MTQRHQWTGTSVKRVEDGEVVPACPSNIVRGTPVQVDTPEVELNVYGYSQELQQRLLSSSALLAEVLPAGQGAFRGRHGRSDEGPDQRHAADG